MQDSDVHMADAEDPPSSAVNSSSAEQLRYPPVDPGFQQTTTALEYDSPPYVHNPRYNHLVDLALMMRRRNWNEAVSPVMSRNYGSTRAQSLGVAPANPAAAQDQTSLALIDPRIQGQQQLTASGAQFQVARYAQHGIDPIDQAGYALGHPSYMPYLSYMRVAYGAAGAIDKLPPWSVELVLSADPYAYRADLIGLSHGIPGIGYLGDELRPPGWRNGSAIMTPAAAEAHFNETRLHFRGMSQVMADAGATVDGGHPLGQQWQNRLMLDQLIFRERVYIYNIFIRKGLIQRQPGSEIPFPNTISIPPEIYNGRIQPQPSQSQIAAARLMQQQQQQMRQQHQQQATSKITPGIISTSQALRQVTGTDGPQYNHNLPEQDSRRLTTAQIMVEMHNDTSSASTAAQIAGTGTNMAVRQQHARKSSADSKALTRIPPSGGTNMSDVEMESEGTPTPKAKPPLLKTQKQPAPKKIHWYNDTLEALPLGEITQEAQDAAAAYGKTVAQAKANKAAAKVAAEVKQDNEEEKEKPAAAKAKAKPRARKPRVTAKNPDVWMEGDDGEDRTRVGIGPNLVASLRRAGIMEVRPGDPSHEHVDRYVAMIEDTYRVDGWANYMYGPLPSSAQKLYLEKNGWEVAVAQGKAIDAQKKLMEKARAEIEAHRIRLAAKEIDNQQMEVDSAVENARNMRAEARSLRRAPAVENMRAEPVSVVVGESAPNLPSAVPLPTEPTQPRKKSPEDSELSDLSDRDFDPPPHPAATPAPTKPKTGRRVKAPQSRVRR